MLTVRCLLYFTLLYCFVQIRLTGRSTAVVIALSDAAVRAGDRCIGRCSVAQIYKPNNLLQRPAAA